MTGPTPSGSSTIRRWECPECGRVFGSAPMSDEVIGVPQHSPAWSPEFERHPMPCDGTPVERVYVRVDALLSDEADGASFASQTYEMVVAGGEALRGHVPVIGCSCRWDEHGNPPPDCKCADRVTGQLRDYAYKVLDAALRPDGGH